MLGISPTVSVSKKTNFIIEDNGEKNPEGNA